jgi:anthranilate phosphoribosyltransferase
MKHYIEQCANGGDLSEEEASDALGLIMTGQATDAQIAGLLMALRTKGESVAELVGFASAMRAHCVRIRVDDPDAVDIVGTGGDGMGTFNISTVAAIVVAGAGVTVAKHGNRSVSSRCGSADVLRELGVGVDSDPSTVEACIARTGIGFLFAPAFHPAMKHAARSRADLGVRTIFNLLGPLTNPAGVRRHVIGTSHSGAAEKLAAAIDRLETDRSCVVQSTEGMDEIGLGAPTRVLELRPPGPMADYRVQASDFGLQPQHVHAMAGGDAVENARIARSVLAGEPGAQRDVVIANAAAGLYVAGKVTSLRDGAALAVESIDSGRAAEALSRLIHFTAAA